MIYEVPSQIFNIGIDSNFRDKSIYPNPSSYTISFDNVFKNVASVELVYAIYEKNGVDLYINMQVDELSPNLISNSNHISGSFCQLPLIHPLNSYDSSTYKSIKIFDKPLAKLSKFTIRFLKPDGSLYNMRDHMLRFEVNCMKMNGTPKEYNEIISNSVNIMSSNRGVGARAPVGGVNIDVYSLFHLPEQYNMETLKMAFKSAADTLRAQVTDKQAYKTKYNELREAFKLLALTKNL
jgi:hypothetical protein